MCPFWVRSLMKKVYNFSMPMGLGPTLETEGSSFIRPVHISTILPGWLKLTRNDGPCGRIPSSHRRLYRCRCHKRYRNINLFPFHPAQLRDEFRIDLLLACDELPRNPYPFSGADFNRSALLLPPGSALVHGPQDITALLQSMHYASLPDQ